MGNKAGNSLVSDLRSELNKAAKENIAYDLHGDNPTDVKTWISTGSTLLDYIISNRRDGGIPVGKLTTIAGESASGKSLVVTQILANTQKMGGVAVYIDTENAASPDFMEQLGLDTKNNFMYVQPGTIEEVFETIERLIGLIRVKAPDRLVCIVWDSVAGTPVKAEIEGDYDPNSRIGLTAKALAKGMRKVTEALGKEQIAVVFTNQLKTNIPSGPNARIVAMTTPYMTPGGKAMHYSYSLRIWLTGRKAKSAFIEDDKGFRIGSEVKVKLEKSRFGTQGRNCAFRILWGTEDIGVRDEESWFDAVKSSEHLTSAGAWYTLKMPDGYEKKFQPSKWTELIHADEEFKNNIIKLMDEEVVQKFDRREGSAEQFYADPE